MSWMATAFARRGYNSAFMTLPYHGSREPAGYKPADFFLRADRWESFEHAVVEALARVHNSG